MQVPDWCKAAAEEIDGLGCDSSVMPEPEEVAAIIAKHAPDVRELVEAARGVKANIEQNGRVCDDECCEEVRNRLRRALEPFEEPNPATHNFLDKENPSGKVSTNDDQ